MKNTYDDVRRLATAAVEALKLAFHENPDSRTNGLILAALATVTQMQEKLNDKDTACCQYDPSEYCAPV